MPIEFPSIQSTQKHNKSIYYIFLPSFPNLPLLLYFSSFFVVLHGRWIDDDDEALELLGRLEQPIAAARPDGVPLGHVRFRVLRDIADVSCVSRSRRGSSGNVSLRIALIAGGTRSRCGHPLDVGRSKNQLGPTSNNLAPYHACDLIRRQQVLYSNSKRLTTRSMSRVAPPPSATACKWTGRS